LSPEDPLLVVQTYLHTRNSDLFALDAEFRFMSQSEPLCGRQAIDVVLRMFYQEMFSEVRLEPRILYATDKGIVAEFMFCGKNTGPLMGTLPTGKEVAIPMIGVYEVGGAHITRARLYYDTYLVAKQLGLFTELW
jgi:predicted ester cyclase